MNPKWSDCSRGRRQSPIDVTPQSLLFDPSLTGLTVAGHQISGRLVNTGRDIRFVVENETTVVSGGPLSYEYRLHELVLHYGRSDDASGSEHTISGQRFAAELQFYLFNHDLYSSWQESVNQPNGVTAIAVLIQTQNQSSPSNHSLSHLISSHAESVRKKGSYSPLTRLSLSHLMPTTSGFVTYDGSLTTPSCVESVHWIIVNRPVYVSSQELTRLRSLIQLHGQGEGNSRPTQPLNSRPLRTNIRPSIVEKTTDRHKVEGGARDGERERLAFCARRGLVTYKGMQNLVVVRGVACDARMHSM